jgi:iron complex transport system substrate-binding protein
MRIKFRRRFRVYGLRFTGGARWRFALLAGLLLSSSLVAEGPRVISMAPHLTEMAFAVGAGDKLVGVVDWSDFPPEATALPSIGDAFRFDLERIMALAPDLALAWRGGTPLRAVVRLEELGIEILWIESRSLEQIAEALVILGQRLGTAEAGARAATEFRTALADLENAAAAKTSNLRVFYQASARPLYTLGGHHVINEVFALCGLENIFADLDIEATVVDFEAVVAARPDLIIAGVENSTNAPLADWKDSDLIDLGQTTLHQVEPTLLVRPTPRIIEGIEYICRLARDRHQRPENRDDNGGRDP